MPPFLSAAVTIASGDAAVPRIASSGGTEPGGSMSTGGPAAAAVGTSTSTRAAASTARVTGRRVTEPNSSRFAGKFPGGEGNKTLTAGPQRRRYDAHVTPAEVAWKLYREGPGRYDAATELARGIAGRRRRAGRRGGARGHPAVRRRPRTTTRPPRGSGALEHGAAPQLLAYLDTACTLRTGSGRAARAALSRHLAAAPDPLHTDMPWLAATVGAPVLVVAGRPPRRAVARAGRRCSPHAACGTGRRSARAAAVCCR